MDKDKEETDWQQVAQTLQQEVDGYRRAARRSALEAELTAVGANLAILPLLLDASAQAEGEVTTVAADLVKRYPEVFAQETLLPTQTVTPPLTDGGLDRQAIALMRAEDINKHWNEVKNVLRKDG